MLFKRGDRGENVKRIQRALNRFGFNLNDDGDFGRLTDEAVREFQQQNNLKVDGLVGKDTLKALGLDPDTLEELASASNGEDIDFSSDEEEIPAVVQGEINMYVALLLEQHNKLLNALLTALAQFETTMSFASAKDADPDIFGTLVSTSFEVGVEKVLGLIPGLSEAKKFYDSVTAELDRTGKASQSLKLGDWIKDQRTAIGNQLLQATIKDKRDLLKADTESDFLEQDQQGRKEFFDQIHQATMKLSGPVGFSIDELEAKLYEQWINAHFSEIGEDTPGCIEYRLEFDDNIFDLVSCAVKAPSGDKIDSALNLLLIRGQLPGIRRPIDFKVRKRVCLFVDNFVDGKSWSCGWLDKENNIIHIPIIDEAEKGLREPVWRVSTQRFKSE
jgi:hypothetical protein